MNKADFNYDEFFQDLVDQVFEIASNLNPEGVLRIPQYIITKLGYHDKQSLQEGLLNQVYNRVARLLGTDSETIVETMKDRIVPIRED